MVYASKQGETQRRLRYGMVGGGRDAFIGAVHRMAIRLDEDAELVAGALCSDPERARASAVDIGIPAGRGYGDYLEMARAEAAREDGIEAVVIVTPNHLHAPVASAFLETGVDVICDKPLSATVDEAEELVRLTRRTNRVFAVTLSNSGYPMVRQLREMITGGAIGGLRGIHSEYVQDWLAQPIDVEGQKQAEWRTDPARAGLSSVLGDIGTHAMHLAAYSTGLELERVAADLSTAVSGRRLDDNANVLMRWEGGVPGTLIASQTAYGHYNDLSIRIYGDTGGLRWSGLAPEIIEFTRWANRLGALPAAGRVPRPRHWVRPGCLQPTPKATSRRSPISTGMRLTSSAHIAPERRRIGRNGCPWSRTGRAASSLSRLR